MSNPPSFPPPPGDTPPPPPVGGTPSGGPTSSPDIGASFSWAIDKIQKHFVAMVIGWFLLFLAVMVVAAVVFTPVFVVTAATGGMFDDTYTAPTYGDVALQTVLTSIAGLVFTALAGPFMANLMRVSLMIADGESPGVGDMFKVPRGGATFVIAAILGAISAAISLLGVIPILGSILSFVLSLAFALIFIPTWFSFFDDRLDGTDALRSGIGYVKSSFVAILVLALLAALISFVGIFACCIGLFVTVPVAYLFMAHQWRQLTGGRIVA